MLVSPKEILGPAFARGQLIGAFNTGNLEMTMGILRAAEEMNRPVLLQIAEKRLGHAPLHLMGPLMVSAARQAKTPVAVQLDHGETPDVICAACDFGFTGIMFDGSGLPLEENIARTRALRGSLGASVWLEGEVGMLAGSEGGPEATALHTDPAQAERYALQAGCDCLAVSIGNAHGHYKGKPQLNFAVLTAIRKRLPQKPLVLHGGSGLPREDLLRAAGMGVCKVNIATAGFDACRRGAAQTPRDGDYFVMNEHMVRAVRESVLRQLERFTL
ncbi:MAG: class II fructose-bisphosphate aldolase [Oscillospiraceae bacterium]|nr:class II fructose-bisphosphate aldolase [Oscillospiraceae bacterium]